MPDAIEGPADKEFPHESGSIVGSTSSEMVELQAVEESQTKYDTRRYMIHFSISILTLLTLPQPFGLFF